MSRTASAWLRGSDVRSENALSEAESESSTAAARAATSDKNGIREEAKRIRRGRQVLRGRRRRRRRRRRRGEGDGARARTCTGRRSSRWRTRAGAGGDGAVAQGARGRIGVNGAGAGAGGAGSASTQRFANEKMRASPAAAGATAVGAESAKGDLCSTNLTSRNRIVRPPPGSMSRNAAVLPSCLTKTSGTVRTSSLARPWLTVCHAWQPQTRR